VTGAAYRREAAVGAGTNEWGGVFFYSHALRGGNTGLCKEGER
jgi:hypothetical protein